MNKVLKNIFFIGLIFLSALLTSCGNNDSTNPLESCFFKDSKQFFLTSLFHKNGYYFSKDGFVYYGSYKKGILSFTKQTIGGVQKNLKIKYSYEYDKKSHLVICNDSENHEIVFKYNPLTKALSLKRDPHNIESSGSYKLYKRFKPTNLVKTKLMGKAFKATVYGENLLLQFYSDGRIFYHWTYSGSMKSDYPRYNWGIPKVKGNVIEMRAAAYSFDSIFLYNEEENTITGYWKGSTTPVTLEECEFDSSFAPETNWNKKD